MTEKRCEGVIVTDADGNFIERYGCEAHLFDKGPCPWQDAMLAERQARRTENVEPST